MHFVDYVFRMDTDETATSELEREHEHHQLPESSNSVIREEEEEEEEDTLDVSKKGLQKTNATSATSSTPDGFFRTPEDSQVPILVDVLIKTSIFCHVKGRNVLCKLV